MLYYGSLTCEVTKDPLLRERESSVHKKTTVHLIPVVYMQESQATVLHMPNLLLDGLCQHIYNTTSNAPSLEI
jgi:hypothetical protein